MRLVTVLIVLAVSSMGAFASDFVTPTAITNVGVVRLDRGDVEPGQTVIVERGVVTKIGAAGTVAVPAGARTVDGRGKFLMPGLIDVHIHLHANPEEEQKAILKLFVANGVTTVLNMRGNPQILELRAGVAAGRVLAPTIFTVGPYVNEPFVTSPDDVEKAVVAQRRAGYDFIKLHGDLSREAYARLAAVARRENIRVIGHAPRNLGLDAMFEERQYALAHAEEFIYDTANTSRNAVARVEPQIPALARRMVETDTWLMPNLTAFKAIIGMVDDLDAMLARPEMQYLPASVRTVWGPATNPYTRRFGRNLLPDMTSLYGLLEKIVRGFRDGGVRMLVGTDAMNTGTVPGVSAHDELADLVVAGLTPLEALRAATTNAAQFLSLHGQSGLVVPGERADLLLLDANPLQDIANTRKIAGVMVRGRWVSREEIRKIHDELFTGPVEQPQVLKSARIVFDTSARSSRPTFDTALDVVVEAVSGEARTEVARKRSSLLRMRTDTPVSLVLDVKTPAKRKAIDRLVTRISPAGATFGRSVFHTTLTLTFQGGGKESTLVQKRYALALGEGTTEQVVETSLTEAGDAVRGELEETYRGLEAALERNDAEGALRFQATDFSAVDAMGATLTYEGMAERARLMHRSIRPPVFTHHTLGAIAPQGPDEATVTVRQAYARMQSVSGRIRKVETSVTQDETWVRTAAGWRRRLVANVRDTEWFVDGAPTPPEHGYALPITEGRTHVAQDRP